MRFLLSREVSVALSLFCTRQMLIYGPLMCVSVWLSLSGRMQSAFASVFADQLIPSGKCRLLVHKKRLLDGSIRDFDTN